MGQEQSSRRDEDGNKYETEGSSRDNFSATSRNDNGEIYRKSASLRSPSVANLHDLIDRNRDGVQSKRNPDEISEQNKKLLDSVFKAAKEDEPPSKPASRTSNHYRNDPHDPENDGHHVKPKHNRVMDEQDRKILDKTLALTLKGIHWRTDWNGEKEQFCRMPGGEKEQFATDEYFVAKHKEMVALYAVDMDEQLVNTDSSQVQARSRAHQSIGLQSNRGTLDAG